MSAARHAAKPRAKFMLRIMAFVSVAGSCCVPLGPSRCAFRELERRYAASRSSHKGAGRSHLVRVVAGFTRAVRFASRHYLGDQSTKLAETFIRLAAS